MKREGTERTLVLVKALPHASQHGETVCCAGVTEKREWRRQYPIRFRTLASKFQRWDWVEYNWRMPTGDLRPESRRVQEETIQTVGKMKASERSRFIKPLILPSTDDAAAQGKTLTLIRPLRPKLSSSRKSEEELDAERRAYHLVASQQSLFDEELSELEPCPYTFKYTYETADGKSHSAVCGDWETAATYFRFAKQFGSEAALDRLSEIFGKEYPYKGMLFAMGTHSRRANQWLLVGVIRADEVSQLEFDV